ncbi:electroneutral sodium bicarbonate exchanger 1-like isoform 1-T1 [Morphnus guianensis]
MKKIPTGAEASNVLVGELDFLHQPIMAFVRLSPAVLLSGMTEVPIPTRFLFVLLGPEGKGHQYHEIGRSMATIMTDEVRQDEIAPGHFCLSSALPVSEVVRKRICCPSCPQLSK